MISKEQIAHDLAIAYVNNRYGVEVSGDFDVNSSSNYIDGTNVISDVYGSGKVSTERLPDVSIPRIIKVGTGEKGLFGIEKEKRVQDGYSYLADDQFLNMISDYRAAYSRFLILLEQE